MEDPQIQARREARWNMILQRLEIGDSWVDRGLRPLAQLAREDPDLGRLFPFKSLWRLCFSRCSDYPFTNDCPCIGVDREGAYFVAPAPYDWDEDGNLRASPDWVDATDATHAIALAVAGLPPNVGELWVGPDR